MRKDELVVAVEDKLVICKQPERVEA